MEKGKMGETEKKAEGRFPHRVDPPGRAEAKVRAEQGVDVCRNLRQRLACSLNRVIARSFSQSSSSCVCPEHLLTNDRYVILRLA